jgi:predicted phosphodiesterase
MGSTYAVVLGDVHAPYGCRRSLKKAIALIEQLQPQYVVQVGDARDLYSFSRYGKSLNHLSPIAEITRGTKQLKEMWAAIRNASPKSKLHQMLGNHDARLYKKIEEKLPEAAGLLGWNDLFEFEGVTTAKSDRDILKLRLGGQQIYFHHGFLSKPGDHVRFFRNSCVTGHSHRGHVLYDASHDRVMWDANCGYLGDPRAHVFQYGAVAGKNKWTRGVLVIDTLGPRFVSFERQ